VPDTSLRDVRAFWEEHPVAAAAVPHEPGTREFFEHYDRLREENEPVRFSYRLHEYEQFAGQRVLDVGCGNGYVLSRFAREGAHTYGIDLTATAVGLSRRRFELEGLDGRFVVGSAEDLPFPTASFDCVTSMGVLHHTPDTARAVGEVHRVLKPGGRLIVMFYHRDSAVYRRLKLRARRSGRDLQEFVNEVDGVGNPKGDVYTRDELRALLHQFTDLELSVGMLQGLPVGRHRFPPKMLLKPFASRWGWFLYAKGRKAARAG
jgi:ubiquinone/menaquinone biosynthesis C-methylase UbiE